jgi:hypothetical protein
LSLRLFNFKRSKFLLFGLGFVFLLLLSGCGSKPISLMNAPLDSGPEAPLKPTAEELQTSKSFIAFVPVQFSENLSRYHKALSVSFVQSVLEEHGDLKIIDDVRVLRALNSSQFTPLRTSLEKNKLRRIDEKLKNQTIELGKWLRVRYIVLMSVQSSPKKVSSTEWSTYISFRIYRVEDPVKIEMNHEFTYVFSESSDLWEEVGALVRGRFPLGGFIVESRANRLYVRVNLGRHNRITEDQVCKIFRRVEKEKKGTNGKMITSIEFDRIGQVTLFRVQEDFSWGKVPSNFRKDVLNGDAIRCY